MRLFYLFIGLVAGLWLPHATANMPSVAPSAIALSQLGNTLGTPHLTLRENLPRALGIERIANEPALFTQSFDPTIAYAMGAQSATWLHFRVLADDKPSPTGWTLELPKPYIQHAEFHHKDAQGQWQMQVAGLHTAHTQWPLQGLHPQFALPVMTAGVHDFYLKLQSNIPLHFSVHLQRTDAANARTQNTFLLGGLFLGACALMLAFSAVLVFIAGQKAYAWYALFVGLSSLATAANMGLTKYALWPNATVWPEYSIYSLVMISITSQLQFCRAIFLPRTERSWLHSLLSCATGFNLVAIGLYFFADNPIHRQILYTLVNCLCTVLALVLVTRALRQGNQTAWLWLLAYVPLIISVALASADSFGFAINGLPYAAPVYALFFEVLVLLVALQLHAKSHQAQSVRRNLLDSIDPHTGFVASRIHHATADTLWSQARHSQRDLAVAYVEAKSTAVDCLPQIVRLLRTVVSDDDTVAHVDKNLYALLMPGLPAGEELANRLSRLVALGLMSGKDAQASSPVQFRIVASTRGSFRGTWQEMDAALMAKLKQTSGWGQRSIRFVSDRSSGDFDALWLHAVAASAPLATP
jgi:two-component system, sensor histidine kinase LadS